ncbi:MAG: tRNA 2-thiouridine(34) synthase MnmA [Thermoguttaceae bacterium]
MARVILAMSGGVDSSVAAWLLREQGHDVVGVFMRHGQQPSPQPPLPPAGDGSCPCGPLSREGEGSSEQASCGKQGCCTAADAADARRVADMLGIPFYVVNFQAEFDRIVEYFVREYVAGRTPNPCIVCNTWLKFGRLFDYADQLGAQYVATGHYARLLPTADGQVALCRGLDATKDQSYVLFGIQRSFLPRLMFPVGGHRKEEIRRMAARLGLRVAAKRDSQEICFVPDQDHARFIRQRRGGLDSSGEIVTTDGAVVGHHRGFEQFTIGQRKGLGVAFGEPRYVVRIEPDSRRVVMGTREDLARTELFAAEANWLVDWPDVAVSEGPFSCSVKIRYRSPAVDARVERLVGGRFRVCFEEPCYGVAPGQGAVCYQGDRVLGGGWIEGPAGGRS